MKIGLIQLDRDNYVAFPGRVMNLEVLQYQCICIQIVKFHNRGQKASNIKQKTDTLCYHHGSEKQISSIIAP